MIYLVESGGADLPTQSELFVHGRQDLPRTDPALGRRDPDHRPGLRQLDRGRRLRARDVRLRRARGRAGQGVPRRPAAGEDGDRRGRRRRAARRGRDALGGLGADATTSPSTSSTAIRIGRADRRRPELAQARPRARPGRPTSRCTTPRSCSASPRSDFRVPFDPREVLARIVDGSRVQRVQATLRHQPGHRLGVHPRLPGRRRSPTTAACCSARRRRRRRSSSCSPTRPTPRWSSCRTPPATWSARSYEQGGIIKDGAKMINAVANSAGAALHDQHRRVLRRGQLRHVRPRLRPPADVRLGQRPAGRDGRRSSSPACCRSSAGSRRRRPAAPSTPPPTTSAGGEIEAQIERESHSFFISGQALRRRCDRPPRHPHRAWHRRCRPRTPPPIARAPRLRRLPDVGAAASDRISKLLIANRGEIASPGDPLRAGARTSPPWRCSPTPDAGAPFVREADEAVALPRCRGRGDLLCAAAIIDAAPARRRRRGPSRLRLPFRERGLRAGLRRRGAHLRRPAPAAIDAMGSKTAAKQLMAMRASRFCPALEIRQRR